MIRSLFIRDYLLIDEVTIDFESGFTVITGETGAGKSLIVDTLSLVLGARADTGIIRPGCNKSEITAVFSKSETVQQWLLDRDLSDDDELIIRRIIHREQASRAYVNGSVIPAQLLRELGAQLVEIHGQLEFQSILKPEFQRKTLDGFAGQLDKTETLKRIAKQIRSMEKQQSSVSSRKLKLEEEIDLIQYQINVLETLQAETGEFSELKSELVELSHAEELASLLFDVAQRLTYDEQHSVSGTLSEVERLINRASAIRPNLEEFLTMIAEARVRVDETARELGSISGSTEYNPARIEEIEQRMSALQQQARVHAADADYLPEKLDDLRSDLDSLTENYQELTSLDSEINLLKTRYKDIGGEVSKVRQSAVTNLGRKITQKMQKLGMEKGKFSIELIPEFLDTYTDYGAENARFMVTTNTGQTPGPLSKVASGGELSRINLAIQTITAENTAVPLIVFDEIDVGIGGKVAANVGRELRHLGESIQVLCITHLPQVASCADQQLNVTKTNTEFSQIDVRTLDRQERIMELARMLGGAKITDRTKEHATEMLSE